MRKYKKIVPKSDETLFAEALEDFTRLELSYFIDGKYLYFFLEKRTDDKHCDDFKRRIRFFTDLCSKKYFLSKIPSQSGYGPCERVFFQKLMKKES